MEPNTELGWNTGNKVFLGQDRVHTKYSKISVAVINNSNSANTGITDISILDIVMYPNINCAWVRGAQKWGESLKYTYSVLKKVLPILWTEIYLLLCFLSLIFF